MIRILDHLLPPPTLGRHYHLQYNLYSMEKEKILTLTCILSSDYQVVIIILSCVLTGTICQTYCSSYGEFYLQVTEMTRVSNNCLI